MEAFDLSGLTTATHFELVWISVSQQVSLRGL